MTNIIEMLATDSKVNECLHCQLRDALNAYYLQCDERHGDRTVLDVAHALKHLSMLVAEIISSGPTAEDRDEAIVEFSVVVRDHVKYLRKIGAAPRGVKLS